jgi:60 kDa SS-A/Ro ribonucleoprotein
MCAFFYQPIPQNTTIRTKQKMKYAKNSGVSKKATHQTQPIIGRESEMGENSAGGFTFTIDPFSQVKRFLILGSEGGSYYASEQKLTQENAKNTIEAIKKDGVRVLEEVLEVSDKGLAKSNDPAIFVLALAFAFGDQDTKTKAEEILPKVCRIGTHILHFVDFVNTLTGWNRRLRRAVANWYRHKDDSKLEFQMVKYQSRDGWSHHDVLHLCHARPMTQAQDNLFHWAKTKQFKNPELNGKFLDGYFRVHANPDVKSAVRIISEAGLTAEMLPTQLLNEKEIWEALLPNLGYMALVRNLGRLSAIKLIEPFGKARNKIVETLTNEEVVQKSRIHPLSLLMASSVYSAGRGVKGSLAWMVDPKVEEALESAFYMSFKNVEPTGKRVLLALDVSGSMGWGHIAGTAISPAKASTAMALVTARAEKDYEIVGFSTKLIRLNISPSDTLASAMKKTSNINFGGTDCSQPMLWAAKNGVKDIGGFVVYTDNETYAGEIHPSQALQTYRNQHGPGARMAVVGMTATKFSIADPKDPGMLDLVGFDSSAPKVLSDFIAGKF